MAGTRSPQWSRSFSPNTRISELRLAIHTENVSSVYPSPPPPTPRFLCSGAPFVIDHKKVPFDFPLLVRQLQVVHSTEIKSVSHETFFFHFPLPPFAQLIRTLKPTNNFPSREMKSRLQQEENRRHHKKAPVWFQIPRSAIKRCDVFLF